MADADNVVFEVMNVRTNLDAFQAALTAMFQRVTDALAGMPGGDSPALHQATMDLQDIGNRLFNLKAAVDAQPMPTPPPPGP